MTKLLTIVCLLYAVMVWSIYLTYDPKDWWAALVLSIGCPAIGFIIGYLGPRWLYR